MSEIDHETREGDAAPEASREARNLRAVVRHLSERLTAVTRGEARPDDPMTAAFVEAALSGRPACPDCDAGLVPEHVEDMVAAGSDCPRCGGLAFVPTGDPARHADDHLAALTQELHLLEEVCAIYSRDEDRFNRTDGESEAYGSVPTEAGIKARSARARFDAREVAEERAETSRLRSALELAATPGDRGQAQAELDLHAEVTAAKDAVRAGRSVFD